MRKLFDLPQKITKLKVFDKKKNKDVYLFFVKILHNFLIVNYQPLKTLYFLKLSVFIFLFITVSADGLNIFDGLLCSDEKDEDPVIPIGPDGKRLKNSNWAVAVMALAWVLGLINMFFNRPPGG